MSVRQIRSLLFLVMIVILVSFNCIVLPFDIICQYYFNSLIIASVIPMVEAAPWLRTAGLPVSFIIS